MRGTKTLVWSVVACVLLSLSIPWFLWNNATVIAGLPVWLWWHVGWMVLTAGVLALFARTAWGVGVETDAPEVAP
jgi:hypothetical protein